MKGSAPALPSGVIRCLSAAGVAVWLASCATVPQAELGSYVDAFDGAQEAALDIYGALQPAFDDLRRKGLLVEFSQPTPGPADVAGVSETPGGAGLTATAAAEAGDAGDAAGIETATTDTAEETLATGSVPVTGAAALTLIEALGPGWTSQVDGCEPLNGYSHLLVRCQAIEFAARYNAVLSSLTENTPRANIKTELFALQGYVGAPGDQAGGAGALFGLLTQSFVSPHVLPDAMLTSIRSVIQKAIEANRNDDILNELKEALPEVAHLVSLLRQDVAYIYGLQRRHYEGLLLQQSVSVSQAINQSYTALIAAAEHETANRAQITRDADRFEAALAEVGDYPLFLNLYGEDATIRTPADALARIRETQAVSNPIALRARIAKRGFDKHLATLQSTGSAFSADVARWKRFEQALRLYESVLVDLEASLTLLTDQVNAQATTNTLGYLASAASSIDRLGIVLGLGPAVGLVPPSDIDQRSLDDLAASIDRRVAEIHALLTVPED